MYVIVVYDTAVERNAAILRTCRQYLHHVQRSVFEGHLSQAQLARFEHAVKQAINPDHDHVLCYTLPPGAEPHRHSIGTGKPEPSDIL
jgi:CRISPR-associated protein Cas2